MAGKKKGKAAGGAAPKKEKKKATSNSTNKANSSPSSSWIHLVITALSFLVGVLTPPLLHYMQLQEGGSVGRSLVDNAHHDDPIVVLPPVPKTNCNHDSDDLVDFLADNPVPGQHVMCWGKDGISVYRNSKSNLQYHIDAPDSWNTLQHALQKTLNLDNRRYPVQPWAVFDRNGVRMADEETRTDASSSNGLLTQMQKVGVFVLFEGGVWIWPGIAKGHVRHVPLNYVPNNSKVGEENRNATLVTLSLNPLVFSVHGFLSDDECTYIQEQATPHMQYSGVTLMDKDKGRPASDFRTSQTAFLGGTKYPGLETIDHRTSSLVRIPRTHQEYVQVLRYGQTEKYNAHADFFDPAMYKNDAKTMKLIEGGNKNRLATVFWYLTDVEAGGHTIFPRVDKGPHPQSTSDCSVGLKVKPERGKVIIFYSMTPEGATDPYSLHGACPVEEGIKWAANKWVWNKPTGFYRE